MRPALHLAHAADCDVPVAWQQTMMRLHIISKLHLVFAPFRLSTVSNCNEHSSRQEIGEK
jgi:hypothetical protein